MAFTPLTSSQPISYVASRSAYRNAAREQMDGPGVPGTPVYYCPSYASASYSSGYIGPRYKYGYTYNNCPSPENSYNGNCTWWCWGRLYSTIGTALDGYGNGASWYDTHQSRGGDTATDASDINPGDIICLTDGGFGHVMFVEKVEGDTVTISQSAYSQRSIWNGMACLVTTFSKSEIRAGYSLNIYKDLDSPAYQTVVGILKTGQPGPTPPGPTPSEDLEISIDPSGYSVTMSASENYVDFSYRITVTGIPAGETISGGNTYPGLTRIYNSGWSYSDYVVANVTYRRGEKQQTLRYERESDNAYQTTKYMYFNISKSTGTVSTTTAMNIDVEAVHDSSVLAAILLRSALKRKRKRGRYSVNIHI